MELKVELNNLHNTFSILLQNPKNGIERSLSGGVLYRRRCRYMNPKNGIESLTPTPQGVGWGLAPRNPKNGIESIEMAESGHTKCVENPKNGIERGSWRRGSETL